MLQLDAAMDSGMLFQSAIVRGMKEDMNSLVLVRRVSNFFLLVSIPRNGLCESFKSTSAIDSAISPCRISYMKANLWTRRLTCKSSIFNKSAVWNRQEGISWNFTSVFPRKNNDKNLINSPLRLRSDWPCQHGYAMPSVAKVLRPVSEFSYPGSKFLSPSPYI